MPTVRRAGAAKFMLEIEGETAGWLTGASGGLAAGTVVAANGGGAIPNKQLAAITYQDLVLLAPPSGMSKSFYAWLRAVADRDAAAARKSGAIIVADTAGNERRRLSFANGLLAEIAFPTADARSKEAGMLALRVQPQSSRVLFPSAGKIVITPKMKKQKPLATSNFRLTLGSLPTKRVTKVELPKLTAMVAAEGTGRKRDIETSIRFDVSAFEVEIAVADARSWYDWYDKFVLQGQNGQDAELDGALEFLSADGKTTAFRVALHGVGPTAFAFLDATPDDAAPRVRASLYCEDVDLSGAEFG